MKAEIEEKQAIATGGRTVNTVVCLVCFSKFLYTPTQKGGKAKDFLTVIQRTK